MRKLFLFAAFLFTPHWLKAQDFQNEIYRVVDSLIDADTVRYAWATKDEAEAALNTLYDSVERAYVVAEVSDKTRRGEYSWPFWYFMNEWGRNPPQDTGIRYPSPTQQQWMEIKFNISMNYPSNGCIWQRSFVVHDSLMMDAIRRRYGFDFFQRVAIEADSLDSAGAGLRFPYVISLGKTDSVLRNAFRHLVSATDASSDKGKRRYLEIYFQKGMAIHAIVMNDGGYGFFFDHEQNDAKPYVSEIVQALSWMPPTFLREPVDRTVLWNVVTGEFKWR